MLTMILSSMKRALHCTVPMYAVRSTIHRHTRARVNVKRVAVAAHHPHLIGILFDAQDLHQHRAVCEAYRGDM